MVACVPSGDSSDTDSSNPPATDGGEEQKPEFASGTGTAEDPFVISEPYQWQNMSNHLSSHFVLGADLTMAAIEDLAPIGTASKPFAGTLDGAGHTLKNMIVGAKENAGVFGVISGATIKNLNVSDSVIEFRYKKQDRLYYGGLVAQAKNASKIENCHITSTDVKYASSWGDLIYVGGLVGNLESFSELTYCSIDMAFVVDSQEGNIHLGGIVGAAENAKITGCAATGTVVVRKPSHYLNNKTRQVAGLVFKMSNSSLTNSYAALDFADNTAAAYTAALVYTLDSETQVCYNASFCDFSIEPDATKFNGKYNSCSIQRGSSDIDNLYFRASDGLSLESMNNQMVGEAFGGAFTEGTAHPVLVDYDAFLLALAAQQ